MTSFLNNIPRRKKSGEQLVFSVGESLSELVANSWEGPDSKQLCEQSLCKYVAEIKQIAFSDVENQAETVPGDDEKVRELVLHMEAENLLIKLIEHLDVIPFEARKDTVFIFNGLLRRNICNFLEYFCSGHLEILNRMIRGYSSDAALQFGLMLRECGRYEALAQFIYKSELFPLFFEKYAHLPNFDVAGDAFNTLKELLTTPRNKQIAYEYLENNYDSFVAKYDHLLHSDNFVTRMRSLKMLSELLTDRGNFNLMIRYIDSKKNLKTIMNLLKNKSANIQLETFHIFKIFVANPHKNGDISTTLSQNKIKLIQFLENFQNDKDDPQFVDEKRLLIETLKQMPTLLLQKTSSERLKEKSTPTSASSSSSVTSSPAPAPAPASTKGSAEASGAHPDPHH